MDNTPLNLKITRYDESSSRFSSAIWFNEIQKQNVTVAGVGGIGSFVAFLLSRVKPNTITVYDPDYVDATNMAGQFYNASQIGISKIAAIVENIHNFSSYYSVNSFILKFTEHSIWDKILICGFDNMEARKLAFDVWYNKVSMADENERKDYLLIDARLAAEELQVFCIQGNDTYNIENYKNNFLFDDSEAEHTICSYKQTTFMSNMIASIVVNLFVNFVANKCEPIIDRALPFYTTYSAETMYLKTEL